MRRGQDHDRYAAWAQRAATTEADRRSSSGLRRCVNWRIECPCTPPSSHQAAPAATPEQPTSVSWAIADGPARRAVSHAFCCRHALPAVLWRCWLGGRKGIRPVKTERWGAGVVICLEWGADLHMAQLMPLPLTVSCFSKIQIGFTFLVLAYPGNPERRAVKRVCVL